MDKQMLDYILRNTDFNLQMYIQQVLDDQPDAPDYSAIYTSNIIKEALIKSGAKIAQSDFSADCIEISQAYWRMSRNLCVI